MEATIPAIVGIVAIEMPEAMERVFPLPTAAMTSKTFIMPVTVPRSPSKGQRATKAFMVPKN